MGRDPEATDEGADRPRRPDDAGRRTPSGFSRDVRDAQARAIGSILDEAYTGARRTLIAEMPRLRDVAAYLYEQERIDGDEFEAVMAGRLRPADARRVAGRRRLAAPVGRDPDDVPGACASRPRDAVPAPPRPTRHCRPE